MMLDRLDPAARRRAQHHRTGQPTARARAQPRGVIEDLVDAGIGKAGELDLCHRAKALRREPDRHSGDRRLGQRRIEHALLAEKLEQPVGRAKHATVDADVLPQHQHARIVVHGALERGIDRLHQAELGHASPCA